VATASDGITQGGAGPDEFRTAPLWGVGQCVFFLHDGRTGNLVEAIRDHKSMAARPIRISTGCVLRSSRRSSISCGRSNEKSAGTRQPFS